MSRHRRQQVFVLIGLVVLAVNLRPVAVSVGPLIDELQRGLSMSSAVAGVVTTLPVLCFAGFGVLAPWIARLVGVHRVMFVSLLLCAAGLVARADSHNAGVFIALTIPALAGMATANVLLPSLVKRHFPHRVGLVTGIYTTALAIGLTAASGLTVPIAHATGSWRAGLGSWAVLAVIAAIPWVALVRRDVRPTGEVRRRLSARTVARSPLAWLMAGFFGAQSLQAYSVFGWLPQIFRDAGFSAQTAGLMLALTTATNIPLSFLLPTLAARMQNPRSIIAGLCGSYVVGYLGLLLTPASLPWLWALFIGGGTSMFPLVLGLIGLRARTSEGTAALSGFAQSVGYLISALGPFLMGALYGVTGGWTVPLVVLLALLVPELVCGLLVSRPRFVEDDLPSTRTLDTCGGLSS